jgi:gluconolactonase
LRPIPLTELQKFGEGLNRPEGVVVSRDGRVFASDRDSSVALIRTDGTLKRMGIAHGVPAGLAMDKQGRVLLANYGIEAGRAGAVQRVNVDSGQVDALATALDGTALVSPSAVAVAADGTTYFTHTTWGRSPLDVKPGNPGDGMVCRIDAKGGVKRVAHSIKSAHGCCFDPGDAHLFVVESMSGMVLRYPRRPDGALGEPKPYGKQIGVIPQEVPTAGALAKLSPKERSRLGFGHGCAFDQEGNLWLTLIHANRVVAVTTNYSVTVLINDPEGTLINQPTSISFGGRDMRDVYIGMTGATHIVKARSPVPGLPLAHQR